MKKYRVYGTATVTVTKEVWANNEDEALEKAYDALPYLIAYCGNGGGDKLIGVEGYDETVEAFDDIEYNDTQELEDNPDYFECPECGEECISCRDDDGVLYWYCNECESSFDDYGNEFYPYISEYDDYDDDDEEEDE